MIQTRFPIPKSSFLMTCSLIIGFICLGMGGIVLIGWWGDIAYLKSIVPGFVTMKVNTAICFMLAGGTLLLLHYPPITPRKTWLVRLFALLICVICLLTLLQFLFYWNLGIDEFLMRQPSDDPLSSPPGRMSFAATIAFFPLGIALLLLSLKQTWCIWTAQFIALITGIIPLVGFISYLYNIQPIYAVSLFATMALHTVVTTGLLCGGVLLLRPNEGLMHIITSPYPGGIMARRLMPLVILGPIILGWLRLLGQQAGYYDTIFGLVLMVVSCITTFVIALWFIAHSINQLDIAREQAVSSLKESEERLRLATEATQMGTWDRDLKSSKLFWSPSQERLMGFEPGTFPGTYEAFASLVHPDDRNVLTEAQRVARRNGGQYQAELRFILPNGDERWGLVYGQMIFDDQHQPIRLVGVDFDITERKRTEEELRDNRTRLAGIVESAMDAIITVDEQQKIILFNHSAETMFGYQSQEILGQSLSKLIPIRFRAGHNKHIQRFAETGETTRVMGALGNVSGLRKSGEEFPMEASISQIMVQGQRLFTVILRDITERRRADEALRQSEAHFRAIFEAAGVGNVESDAITGRFLLTNQKMCEISGYSTEELHTMSFRDLTHPEDREQNFAIYQKFVRGELPYYFVEKRYVRKDGSIVWVQVNSRLLNDAEGKPWRTVAVIQDITERKRAEELLQKSEQRFRELVESLPQFIWTCTAEGLCDYLSPQWKTYTGIPAREQLGYGWVNQLHPDDRERALADWQQALATKDVLLSEFRIRRFDGLYRWFRTRAVPMCDETGQLLRWFGNNIDIESLKQAELSIRQLNTELEVRVAERTQELASANRELEAFTYSVSHDLRAPLRAIDGFSRILQEDYASQLSPEASDYLSLVRDNTQRMGQLIDDLLNLSRITRQTLNKQPVNPGEIVHQVLDELQAEQNGRRIEIAIGELPHTQADHSLLKQVFVNLLSNAFKFTSRCETALIEVGCLDAITAHPVYFVKDNGAGFNMKYSHKLFRVFQRLHRMEDYEGTGVGLALVQRIITRHGGRIWAESALGEGATFYFTLNGDESA